MPNGKSIIEQVQKAIDKPEAISTKTAQILTLSLLLDLWGKWEDDHERVDKMWPFYRFGIWVATAVGILVVGFLFAILTHQIRL